jgi:hypothetical protein
MSSRSKKTEATPVDLRKGPWYLEYEEDCDYAWYGAGGRERVHIKFMLMEV